MLPTPSRRPVRCPSGGILSPCLTPRIEELLQPLRDDPERSAVLLDVDGVLAPIVQQPDDAHMPETTRRPLIEVARRYGVVACVSGRRASDARRIVSLGSIAYLGSHGSEVLRAGRDRARAGPRAAGLDAARAGLRPRGVRREAAPAARAPGGQGGDRRPALARRARRGGRAGGDRARSPRPPRRPASSPTGAARCWRSARPCGSTRAPGSSACCATPTSPRRVYVGDDVTDLDAFRGPGRAAGDGAARATRCASACARTRARRRSRGGGRDGRGHGRRPRAAAGAARLTCASATSSRRRSC